MNAGFLKREHAAGLSWDDYLATDAPRASNWRRVHDQVTLDAGQSRLVAGFVRRMNVLFVSGVWCGDCVQQGPLLQRIAEAGDGIDLRFVDRDQHPELIEKVAINGGHRIPVAIFMAEDFEPVSVLGDRTLNRYRALAARQLGPSCPAPGAPIPDDELRATLQDWLDEVERVHLILRLSTRLRQQHGD